MSTNGLAAPGSSEYSSGTMYVGDGTWDSERNTFLLPNLMGLNFDTMRYNGMGNRFRSLAGYKSIVVGHGVVAAITFLGIVPAAIFMARFYHRNPRLALRMHIWLQILTVFLTTVVFTLGWFAVGPARSLTNPHHGIGLAVYVLVLVQAIGGGLIHHREKGRERFKIPLKLMLHQWLGRAIAILGFVQIALGLTLWGSPKFLFILYSLWGFALLLFYFVLSYRNLPVGAFDDDGTYISDYRTEYSEDRRSRRSHGRGLGALAAAGAAGAGLAALRRRSQSRRRSHEQSEEQTVLSSRPPTSHHRPASRHDHEESYLDEKYTEDGRPHNRTWRDRLLGATAGLGAFAAVKSLFSRRKHEQESEVSTYSHPLGGPTTITETDLSRVEEGRAPASPSTPADRYRRTQESEVAEDAALSGSPVRRPGPRTRRSGDSISSWDSRTSYESLRDEQHGGGHGLRDGIAALGVLGFLKHRLGRRKKQKEEMRVEEMREQEIENERVARADSQRRKFTGDGSPPKGPGRPYSDVSDMDSRGSMPELSRHTFGRPAPGPISTPTRPTFGSRIETVGEGSHPATGIPPPPHDPLPMASGAMRAESSDSELYTSPSRRPHRRHTKRDAALAGTGAAVAGAAASRRSESRHRPQSSDTNVTSPPVSVKVKMHKDGRHVTLRRLNEAEAQAEREARRRERKRAGSLSSVSGDERWRRTEQMEAAQAAEMDRQHQPATPQRPPMPDQPLPGPPPGPPPMPKPQQVSPQSATNLPPPPPHGPAGTVSGMGSGLGSGMSPLSPSGTEQSNYDSNRRRRRAERAQARLARGGGPGSRVEFT